MIFRKEELFGEINKGNIRGQKVGLFALYYEVSLDFFHC